MATVTRETLYDQVWAKPMMTVAAEYGVTGTALKKTCKRHDIPTPPRGYWQPIAHGQTIKQTPLPDRPKVSGSITITGSNRPPAVAPAEQVTSTWTLAAQAISGPVSEPRILAATRKAASKGRADHQGFVSVRGPALLGLKVSKDSLERALQIASRLTVVAEACGKRVASTDSGFALDFDGTLVAFRIDEESRQEPHTPTEAELRRGKENARWGMSSTPWPKYDHSPSGRLAIVIEANSYSGLRRTYADGKKQMLEDMMAKVLQGFADHAAYALEQKRAAEERTRVYAEAEARRQRQQAWEAHEKRRWEFVDAIHEQLMRRQRLKCVLRHLEQKSDQPLPMAVWIHQKIALIEALIGRDCLDLSARSAGISFRDEEVKPEDRYRYYEAISLRYWSIDEARGQATAISGQEWLELQEHSKDRAPSGD
jgi:hypothetical protein